MEANRVGFTPIEGANPWAITVNGQPTDVKQLSLQSKWGTLEFGHGSDGRNGWLFTETGGGGSVTTPWAVSPDGELLIGMLNEHRQNMGGAVDCVIGGFKKPDESAQDAANREQADEAGITVAAGELEGVPVNSNRLYFQADSNRGEGVHTFHVPVEFEDLVPVPDHPGWFTHKTWQPKPGTPVIFKPLEEAVSTCPDALAYPGMLRVLTELFKRNRDAFRSCIQDAAQRDPQG